MIRFDPRIRCITALTFVMVGCASSDVAAPQTKAEALSEQTPIPGPPQALARGQLVPLPAVQIDATSANAALGDPQVQSKLRAIALRASSVAGVAQPPKMRVVSASDHQVAETLLSGNMIYDHAPVYVISMTGGPFTATQHPPGAAAPQGQVLTVTVDAATLRVNGIGIVPAEPDLGQLGPTIVDLTSAPAD